jgi:hypothetical protein
MPRVMTLCPETDQAAQTGLSAEPESWTGGQLALRVELACSACGGDHRITSAQCFLEGEEDAFRRRRIKH